MILYDDKCFSLSHETNVASRLPQRVFFVCAWKKMKSSDPPPPKRRRYAEIADLSQTTPSISGPSDAEFSNAATTIIPVLGSLGKSHQEPSGSELVFDPVVFATFVGEELPLETLKQLGDASGGNMERAINM